jgi:hypothetical protein
MLMTGNQKINIQQCTVFYSVDFDTNPNDDNPGYSLVGITLLLNEKGMLKE